VHIGSIIGEGVKTFPSKKLGRAGVLILRLGGGKEIFSAPAPMHMYVCIDQRIRIHFQIKSNIS
jgi:hypothetical protein